MTITETRPKVIEIPTVEEDLDELTLVSQPRCSDQVHRMIRSETVERTKAAAILAAMEAAA